MNSFALIGLCLVAMVACHDGSCGFQCTADSDCKGCGTAGLCSCPDGAEAKYPTISCSCVSKPADPPQSPVTIEDTKWPDQFTCQVEAFSYPDFADATVTAKGKFFFDGVGDRSRAEWSPYTSGKDATQVWIAGTGSADSNYYVLSGPICIYFPITDPGAGGNIGLENANWMQTCNASGYAKYVGREQVTVASSPVWVDHWACHIDYDKVNQSITFQNWNSLGLDGLAKGLPVRVTGGNSAPNPQQGSPRMNTVWYTDFTVGPDSVDPSEFVKPAKFCIPVGADTMDEFFGHPVTPQHASDPTFHQRAHFLPHHAPSKEDMQRAVQPKPAKHMTGENFANAMTKLNGVLLSDPSLATAACDQFTLPELFETMNMLFAARSPSLQQVYSKVDDTRGIAHHTTQTLAAEQKAWTSLVSSKPALTVMVRDGLCHEAVMWYIHHLSSSAQQAVKALHLNMPLLPTTLHEAPKDEPELGARYADQVSCAVCHVA